MRLSHQLLLAMSLTTVLAIGATSYTGIKIASSSLESSYNEKLSAVADGRRNQLETFLSAVDEKMANISRSQALPGALNMLKFGIQELKDGATTKLQNLLTVERDDKSLAEFHKENKTIRYHMQYQNFDPLLRQFAYDNGFGDLYLTNSEGLIVYTVKTGDEIGTNLLDGPFKDTKLGELFRSLVADPTKTTTSLSDYSRYPDQNGRPTALIGIPVANSDGAVFGALVAELSDEKIAEILNNNTGLGMTGETVLIGQDGSFLSDSSNTEAIDPLVTMLDLSGVVAPEGRGVSNGTLNGYRDMTSMAAFANVSFDNANWQVAAIVDRQEALSGTKTMSLWMLSVSIIGLLGALCIGYLFARSLSRPINAVIGNMNELSDGNTDFNLTGGDRKDEVGDIVRAVELFRQSAIEKKRFEEETVLIRDRSDEERLANEAAKLEQVDAVNRTVAELAIGLEVLASGDLVSTLDEKFMESMEPVRQNFNSSVAKLRETLSGINFVAIEIRSDSNEIANATEDLSSRTESQAAALEEASATLEELTGNVRQASEQATEAAKLAQSARADTSQSSSVVSNAMSAMSRIEKASSDISGIINVIDEIAFQTNLLALNAGVEAARAGEAGKGFAVVAQEVRELAGRSAVAAKEIKQLINTSNEEVNQGVKLVKETGEVLEKISGQVSDIETRITTVANGATEQLNGIETVNDAVSEMDNRIQQNAAMAEETTAATMRLVEQIGNLTQMVEVFRIDNAGSKFNAQDLESTKDISLGKVYA